MIRFTFLFLLFFITITAVAQTDRQHAGWLLLLNNTKLNEHWGVYADVQLRSSNEFKNVRNLLIRPGVTYYLNTKHEITLGYLNNTSYTYLNDQPDFHLTEHRIWEQYVFKHKLKAIAVSHRVRLEQRFIGRNQLETQFAQRFRYFVRFIVPLKKEISAFEKGLFAALQNEIFLNIQNKNELNTHVFDQNRAYGAIGYRFNKHMDMEAGYLNQFILGAGNNSLNNVIQIAVYTKF